MSVASDANGNITIGVSYTNRTCAVSGELVLVFLDTDQNSSTGGGGFEYALLFDGIANVRGILQWNGSFFGIVSRGSLSASCQSTGDSWTINRADVGVANGFNFLAASYQDSIAAWILDRAPDSSTWNYDLTTGGAAPPPLPPPPPPPPPPSAKTYKSAANLPSETRYTGKSIRHVRITEKLYATMKALGAPHRLAVACWSVEDWPSVVDSAGGGAGEPGVTSLAFWFPRQPGWLHLSPKACSDLQGLSDTRIPNNQRATALTAVLHETTRAYGVVNEAKANCYAVQLVYIYARLLNFLPARADYLQQLATRRTRATAPKGYWDSARCRSGGAWDLSIASGSFHS